MTRVPSSLEQNRWLPRLLLHLLRGVPWLDPLTPEHRALPLTRICPVILYGALLQVKGDGKERKLLSRVIPAKDRENLVGSIPQEVQYVGHTFRSRCALEGSSAMSCTREMWVCVILRYLHPQVFVCMEGGADGGSDL